MEIHRPHHGQRTAQRLQDCINLGPRGAAKTGKTGKDNMEKDGEERKAIRDGRPGVRYKWQRHVCTNGTKKISNR